MTFLMRPEWAIQIETGDISDLDGWTNFLAKKDLYEPPPLLSRADYEALTDRERAMYDMARRIANNNLPKHETPMTEHIRQQVETVLTSNLFRMDPGVRSGVFISADGAMGKSTLMRDIAAAYDAEVRQYAEFFPNGVKARDRWVPVMWVTVPPKLSIRSLGIAILNFYGEPFRNRATDSEITQRVEAVIRDCGTRLAVLDDITRYKDGEADRLAADWLRNLMETSVTIVAMGVDIRGSGILYDGKGRPRNKRLSTQTARRFTVLEIDTFRYDTAENIRDWIAHLKAVEEDLMLLDKHPGMLSDNLAEFLYERTEGVIGVLADYVQMAATRIIGRDLAHGGERLSRSDFDTIPIRSNDHVTPEPKKKETPKRTKAKGRVTMYDQPRNGAA